jgi:hypothetical protein
MAGTTFSEIPFVSGIQGIVSARNAAEGRRLQERTIEEQALANKNSLAQREADDLRKFNATLDENKRKAKLEEDEAERKKIAAMDESTLKQWETRAKATEILGGRAAIVMRTKPGSEERKRAEATIRELAEPLSAIGLPVPEELNDEWLTAAITNSDGAREFLAKANEVVRVKTGKMGGESSLVMDPVTGKPGIPFAYGEPAPAASTVQTPAKLEKLNIDQEKAILKQTALIFDVVIDNNGNPTGLKAGDQDTFVKTNEVAKSLVVAKDPRVMDGDKVNYAKAAMLARDSVAAGGKQMDAAKAKEYLEKAGGDKEKARELAKTDGYSF